ncbi:hypothetical protein [Arthrobacter sp. L77]|uniref:hypothetical protein n=1 Tax=Arthrobacter sp. L77 TaxID=1496689 RepID=UPI0005B87341|nr:hypothetical protein [Arthrobacter sp. L77]
MTSTPQNHQPQDDASAAAADSMPAAPGARKLQDDPRAQLALAKKNHAASPAAATGAGHAKAAHESSKQGKKEKKVRW